MISDAKHLYAVIIAGGRGKRFWPESRKERPKYLLKLPGQNKTMLQQSAARLQGLLPVGNILVITNKLQKRDIEKQLPRLPKKNIIGEPMMKNSAPAIGLAATTISKKDPNAVMMVLPADQLILAKDEEKFRQALKKAVKISQDTDLLATIGIKPSFPATGFGYIKAGAKIKADIFKAEKFTEKPNLSRAGIFVKSKNYFWNSGIFISKASVMLSEINRHMPELTRGLKSIKNTSNLTKQYRQFPNISIDYGVMEKSKRVCVVKGCFRWHDIGSWKNLCEVIKSDSEGNVTIGPNAKVNVTGSIIIGKKGHLIAAADLKDIVIVHTDDATLVCNKKSSELIRKLVEQIEKNKKFKNFL